MPHATRDPWITQALASGVITTDLNTGLVHCNGELRCFLTNGYVVTSLGSPGRYALAHRVIWISAYGQPDDNTLHVNHRNRIRSDNRLTNLELITAGQNAAHAAGNAYYQGIRPEDEAAVDPAWYATVLSLAARGDVTPEEIAALRGEDLEDNPQTPRWLYTRPGRFSGCRAS